MILWLSLACFLVYIVYCTVTYIRYRSRLTKPIRYVPGPKPLNFLYGNIKEIWNAVCIFGFKLTALASSYQET